MEHAAAAAAKSLQSCSTLCDAIAGSPRGSPVPGILQARTLEWVAISFSSAWKRKVKVKSLSHVRLFATPWTAAYQAPLSMEFSRQEYWSGLLPVEHSHVHLLTVYSLWLLQWNSARVEKLQQRANDLQAWNIYYLFLWKVCLPFRGREKIVVCRILGSSLDLLYQLQFSKILRWFIYKIKFEKYYRW